MSENGKRKRSIQSVKTSAEWNTVNSDMRQKKSASSSRQTHGGSGPLSAREDEVRISQVFQKFDTKRLRDGIMLDDAMREIIWENGFKLPVAPVKNMKNIYLIGSQKMLVECRNG